jgi:hypothetical protein
MIIVTANVGLLPSEIGKKDPILQTRDWVYPATEKMKIGLER